MPPSTTRTSARRHGRRHSPGGRPAGLASVRLLGDRRHSAGWMTTHSRCAGMRTPSTTRAGIQTCWTSGGHPRVTWLGLALRGEPRGPVPDALPVGARDRPGVEGRGDEALPALRIPSPSRTAASHAPTCLAPRGLMTATPGRRAQRPRRSRRPCHPGGSRRDARAPRGRRLRPRPAQPASEPGPRGPSSPSST